MNEDLVYLLKVIEVALIAGVKFAFAPFEAERQGFNFRDAFLITTAGGCVGILAFSFVGEVLMYAWRRIVLLFRNKEKPRRRFTWMNKLVVRTKRRFGLFGLLLMAPSIISIPVGTLVIHHFFRRTKAKNIVLLCVSVLAWGLLLNGVAQYLQLSQYIPH